MKSIKNIIIGFSFALAVTIFTFLVCYILVDIGWIDPSINMILILVSIFNLILLFSIRKKNKKVSLSQLFSTAIIILILFFIRYQNITKSEYKETYTWNSKKDSFTLKFITGKNGRIYIKATINGTTGLFLFDTGAELCVINEKYITNVDKQIEHITVWDINKIKQTNKKFKLNSFKLGTISILNCEVILADTLAWIDPKGIFYKKDSIIGIIGNNIISKFIWDFDLNQYQVTISKAKNYCKNIPDSLAVELVKNDDHVEIPIIVNNKNILSTLDFGLRDPIWIIDSIPDKKKRFKKLGIFQNNIGFLNHLDTVDGINYSLDFVNVKFGMHEFDKIKCIEKAKNNILGIPFVWAFEQVILDYNKRKIYFISKKEKDGDYGVKEISRQLFNQIFNDISKKISKTILNCKPEGMPYIFKLDSTRLRYIIYGKLIIYNNKNSSIQDSIICCDSLLLPNGKIMYGPVDLNKINTIFISNQKNVQ